MGEQDSNLKDMKEQLKEELKKQIKQELLAEIQKELKLEEKASKPEDMKINANQQQETPASAPVSPPKIKDEISITVKAFLKIASHALKYANSKIPRDKWVEVIGLLAGKIENNGTELHIEDAYPMGHGNAIYAEIKDYKNYVRAFTDLKEKGEFICGWYHSHPSYGLFMSNEDLDTQGRYQKLWDKACALVIDPYMIDGNDMGMNIFRADMRSRKWYPIPFNLKGIISTKMLPELLDFINPIVDGKALYLEYDE